MRRHSLGPFRHGPCGQHTFRRDLGGSAARNLGGLLLALVAACGGAEAEPNRQPGACVGDDCALVCRPGATGCACESGDLCADDRAECVAGACQPRGCEAGERYCACDEGACAVGLACAQGVCRPEPGALAGPCYSDRTCDRGLRCQSDACIPCVLGALGCACTDEGGCSGALECEAGLCITRTGLALEPPTDPACLTPCSDDLNDATRQAACSAEGLMEGCLGDAECVAGQCLAPDSDARACSIDADCPDFQACLARRCVSNCDSDDACQAEATCHRRTCRQRCTATGEPCPAQYFCSTADAENGVCMPIETPVGDGEQERDGRFELSRTLLPLSNANTRDAFRIENHDALAARFTIRKVAHRVVAENGDVEDVRPSGECEGSACPLFWLGLGVGDEGEDSSIERLAQLDVIVEPGESVLVAVDATGGPTGARWQGELEVLHREFGAQTVQLTYAERPEGRWTGQVYYFGQFEDQGIDEWIDSGRSPSRVASMRNALMRVWGRFRAADGSVSLDELRAVITATRTESWRSETLAARCPKGHVCFPFNNGPGFKTYTADPIGVPPPSGVVELPMAVNLRPGGDCAGEGVCYSGRVDSTRALHYPGNPHIALGFEHDPARCGEGTCFVALDSLTADVAVGARYRPVTGSCDAGFEAVRTPWLVAGFDRNTVREPTQGRLYTTECRSTAIPLGTDAKGAKALNLGMAAANPIADGHARRRRLELLDGALIEGRNLLVLFRERAESFLEPGGDDLVAYGLMVLERRGADLDQDAYVGTTAELGDTRDHLDAPSCSPELLERITGRQDALATRDRADSYAGQVARGVIEGLSTWAHELAPIAPGGPLNVHYLCEDTGRFNDGGDRVSCPAGSRVTFFVSALSEAQVRDQACQRNGSCHAVLHRWVRTGEHQIALDPVWRCRAPNAVYCANDRVDLRREKMFYAPSEHRAVFVPLRAAVHDAFRYRTRFTSQRGSRVGFVPEICLPDSDAIPYCYDPSTIQEIEDRMDCAVALYTDHLDRLGPAEHALLLNYLTDAFGYRKTTNANNQSSTRFGFEHLRAELLIMLGDDAYTRALQSRFDLAGSQLSSFEGSLFEPGGINLSGAAGFEMVSLYRAAQYYELAASRVFRQSRTLAAAIARRAESGESFITQKTVVSYFDRLVRASTQKARAMSEIAQRYQNFNRPDLARRVIERAYTGGYLESVALTHLMLRIDEVVAPEDRPQITRQVEQGQRSYRVALREMQERYANIDDGVNYFGFAPDYVPFPAIESELARDNAFEVALNRARQRLQLAEQAEQAALTSDRAFETDTAAFQNELARLRTTYEGQLSELCGTFEGDDGRVYPAIQKYGDLDREARLWGDPCGLMGTGRIHQANGGIEVAVTNLRRARTAIANTLREAGIERARWQASCNEVNAFAQTEWVRQGRIDTLQSVIDRIEVFRGGIDRAINIATTAAQLGKCSIVLGTSNGGDCPQAGISFAAFMATMTGLEALNVVADAGARNAAANARRQSRDLGRLRTRFQCDLAEVDGKARVKSILLRLSELELDALRAQYELGQAVAEMRQLRGQAKRVADEMQEMEELAIEVEAARNNPNIRVYRNDAVLNADRTFYSAVREAYMATRVLEYYTSQSYANLDKLFLVRMVSAGDTNLQQYVVELEDAFRGFEDRYGLPDLRLARLSLRDDVLQIPRLDERGQALSETERTVLLRKRLLDAHNYDRNGYLAVPFSTRLNELSPLTRNHKIRYVEAEIMGSDVGDPLGRVYLRMAGTSSVSGVDGELRHYTFPERTAVVNTFFNGHRLYTPQVYQSRRLRDRPFLNSRWELVFNPRDEEVNKDVHLDSITDVRLYVYYDDFTVL